MRRCGTPAAPAGGQFRRHGDARRLATLLATVTYLEARAVDDALELLDLPILKVSRSTAYAALKEHVTAATPP